MRRCTHSRPVTRASDASLRLSGLLLLLLLILNVGQNSLCLSGPRPSTEFPVGPYPFVVDSDDGRQVPVVQAYAFGKYLGYLKVTFDSDGSVVKAAGNPILLNSSIPQGECFLLYCSVLF